jgi:hypothetical protein
MNGAYSALTYGFLVVSVGAPLGAAALFTTVDWGPWLLLVAIGLALAGALRGPLGRLQARITRASARLSAAEVAAADAPGGWVVWVAVPGWILALGLALNVLLDPGPATEHAATVIERTGGKAPRVILSDYRGEGTISFHGNRPLVHALRVGEQVTIVARPGRFGWEWIESIRGDP